MIETSVSHDQEEPSCSFTLSSEKNAIHVEKISGKVWNIFFMVILLFNLHVCKLFLVYNFHSRMSLSLPFPQLADFCFFTLAVGWRLIFSFLREIFSFLPATDQWSNVASKCSNIQSFIHNINIGIHFNLILFYNKWRIRELYFL